MDGKTATRALDWCASMADKRIHFELFGGEPLLNWDVILILLDYSRLRATELSKKITLGCVTNASLLTSERARILAEYAVPLLLSYDGPYTNEATRGHTRDVEAGLRNALAARLKCTVAMQACANHTKHLYENFISIEGMGFNTIAINPVTHCYEPYGEQDWVHIRAALQQLAEHQFDRYVTGKGAVYTQLNKHVKTIKAFMARPYDLTTKNRSCGACKYSIAIDPAGNILPCHQMQPGSGFDHYIMGNVNDGTYDSEIRDRMLMRQQIDMCISCPVIVCSPCRVINYQINHNEMMPGHDACMYQRLMFDVAVNLYNKLIDSEIWDGPKYPAGRECSV